MMWPGVYQAVVTSTADPLAGGRVRLRVPQVSGQAVTGWAPPAQDGGKRPRVGQRLFVMFQGGDASYPVYLPPLA